MTKPVPKKVVVKPKVEDEFGLDNIDDGVADLGTFPTSKA